MVHLEAQSIGTVGPGTGGKPTIRGLNRGLWLLTESPPL